jgi:hypothetical protein
MAYVAAFMVFVFVLLVPDGTITKINIHPEKIWLPLNFSQYLSNCPKVEADGNFILSNQKIKFCAEL